MPWSMAELYLLLPAFLLVLSRVSGLMLSSPLFSSSTIPMQIKVIISGAISLAIFPLMVHQIVLPVTLGSAVAGLIGELSIGLLLGFCVSLVFMGVQVAGQLVSQQAGLALGDVFNPMMDTSSTVVSEVYFFVAIMVFLAVGGDRAMIRALLDSFATVPPMGFRVTPHVTELLLDMLALSFSMALRIAGPTMLSLLLAFMTLGFISRTMPQLNILTVGFPVKLALAIAVMAVTMMSLEPILLEGLKTCMDGVRETLGIEAMN